MKLVTSLLLGSAASFAAVAGAQAADLPAKGKVAPVEYVRVCSAYGAGFFVIPGTETCLKIDGRVRADALYVEPFSRANDTIGLRARGRLNIDARTPTAFGPLRTFIRYEITRDSGTPFGVQQGVATSPDLTQAFVQWGGLTAGRAVSYFDDPDLPTTHMGTLRFDDAPELTLFAYTFSFGGGFSATISAEDGLDRRRNTALIAGIPVDPVTGLPIDTLPPGTAFATFPVINAGQTVPDVVANIRYAGTWGAATLAGAIHQIRDLGVVGGRVDPITGAPLGTIADTEYGWAIGLQGYYNLPFIAEGDAVWVAAAYSQGAMSYNGFGNDTNLGGFQTLGSVDGLINPFNGDIERTKVWNIAGGFTHYWTPEVSSSIFGSYASVEFPGFASATTVSGVTIGFADFTEWRVGANTFWSPVSGLSFGAEVIYAQADTDNPIYALDLGGLGNLSVVKSDVGAVEGRIRVQRDF